MTKKNRKQSIKPIKTKALVNTTKLYTKKRKPYTIKTKVFLEAYDELRELVLADVYDEEIENSARKHLRKFTVSNTKKRNILLYKWAKQADKKNGKIDRRELRALRAIQRM